MEVLQYFENVEQENNKFKNEICPTMEKIIEKFEAKNKEFEKLEIKNKELEERNLCKICLVAEICFVFLPCRHTQGRPSGTKSTSPSSGFQDIWLQVTQYML